MCNNFPFTVGDTVYLNSGSPPLLVESIENGKVTCSWINNGDKKETTAPIECFKLHNF